MHFSSCQYRMRTYRTHCHKAFIVFKCATYISQKCLRPSTQRCCTISSFCLPYMMHFLCASIWICAYTLSRCESLLVHTHRRREEIVFFFINILCCIWHLRYIAYIFFSEFNVHRVCIIWICALCTAYTNMYRWTRDFFRFSQIYDDKFENTLHGEYALASSFHFACQIKLNFNAQNFWKRFSNLICIFCHSFRAYIREKSFSFWIVNLICMCCSAHWTCAARIFNHFSVQD